jgi:hypothetical protein
MRYSRCLGWSTRTRRCQVTSQAAHILKRAVGVFTMDRVKMSRLSLISTPKLDSASTYRGYNVEYPSASLRNVQTNYFNMERLVDDRFKGMMLEHNIHDIFDKLKVYLELTEVSLQSCIPVIPHVDQCPSEKTSTQSRMLGAPLPNTLPEHRPCRMFACSTASPIV